ncbi:MAG: hypothetical protein JXN61_01485 [Sedimentisphaerales bacterium]|nr:hypothetical protein [Sedimentisphaerales bacterium]
MNRTKVSQIRIAVLTLVFLLTAAAVAEDWKHQIVFPDEPYASGGISSGDSGWVKFTIKLDDPNTVYYQDSRRYVLHYDFATDVLDPFVGMSAAAYYSVTLYQAGQQASLGTVILPPMSGYPAEPDFAEYGIQFVRQDPYTKEQIRDMFEVVKASVAAEPGVEAFYFPTYEQTEVAQANRDWFESQGIPISSTSRWAKGNACYSEGWALGELKFVEAGRINRSYQTGLLRPQDILLTDAVPAEIPYVAGIISLSPSTPSSHVAILANTYVVPFVHLAVVEDANHAQQLVGRTVAFSAFDDGLGAYDTRLIDVEDKLTAEQINEILELKKPPALDISPIAHYGGYSANTDDLLPKDVNHFGGKASNYGILRNSIPDDSPVAMGFSFDLWNDFLDQEIVPRVGVVIQPGQHLLFWADDDEEQGPRHTDFKLDNAGEYVGLYDRDGITLIDGKAFGPLGDNISYGRSPDGSGNWIFFSGGGATPGWQNPGGAGPSYGLFINEFMADNETTKEDPDEPGEYPDWIEIYNAGSATIDLGGMYLTDDINEPDKWMIPFTITGNTLREEIGIRLSGYTYPPPDMAVLAADLSVVRTLFKDTSITGFTPLQILNIEGDLLNPQYGFDMAENLRFRSSTNVEDSEQFTGAGLYDSFSGCLADEFDSDDNGPCLCDPCESNERGVFRAIRRVFASFYNDNAFLERIRHDVNESQVGMAMLVHHSFLDEIELANGVATLDKRGSGANMYIRLVTQNGAVSVTNPEGGSIPEEVSVRVYSSGRPGSPRLDRASNLVPLGQTVMDWDADYTALAELLVAVSIEFGAVTGKTTYMLDLEYKKVAPGGAAMPAGGLVIKQIRQLPQPGDTPSITPFLINEPAEFCVFPGEFRFKDGTDVFADHRLKSRWTIETKSQWLSVANLAESFYARVEIEYVDGNSIRTVTEQLPLMPAAYHSFDGTDANDGWLMGDFGNPRTYELQTQNIPTLVSPAENPLLTLRDFGTFPFTLDEPRFKVLGLRVDYSNPVRSWYQHVWPADPPSGPRASVTNEVRLWRWPHPHPDDVLLQRYFESDGISVETEFYWPPPPEGFPDWNYHTAPLVRWVHTVIEGYTTEPVVLEGYYSQTYRPEHHNISEHFLFEPRLEQGISQATLDELAVQDIRLIHLYYDTDGHSEIMTYGFEFVPADLNGEPGVTFSDFCLFAARWLDSNCGACGGADLTGDGQVRASDLHHFAHSWLNVWLSSGDGTASQ